MRKLILALYFMIIVTTMLYAQAPNPFYSEYLAGSNDRERTLSVGDIIVNEIMQNPNSVSDSNGEYFEVYNTTDHDIDINGWTVRDKDFDSFVITNGGPLTVTSLGYLVMGINGDPLINGGYNCDYAYTGMYLSNSADEVILEFSGVIIDSVYYDGGSLFPDPTGASMELDPNHMTSIDNDDGNNWYAATTFYGDGDYGSPGSANSGAPLSVGDIIVDEIMQNPNSVSDSNGEYFEVYNTTDHDIDINGWTVRDKDFDSFVITNGGPLTVTSLGYLVMGINGDPGTNGGYNCDYAYTGMSLSNIADEVILEFSGVIIDSVYYDGGPLFPDPSGASMELDPDHMTSIDNDDGNNWYAATTFYGDGDYGSPGSANSGATIPDPPTDLILTVNGSDIDLSWTVVAGATGYNIFRSTDPYSFGAIYATSVANTYTDVGAADGVKYFYMVTATN